MIKTTMKIVGNKVVSQVHLGDKAFHTNTTEGAALERAINGSHAVKGLHKPEATVNVIDDNSGTQVNYPIVKDTFMRLLAGYGVRHDAARLFA